MKYIKFSNNYELESRYDSDIHDIIPSDCIEVSDELFWKTINEQDGIWSFEPNSKSIYKKSFPKENIEVLRERAWNSIQEIRDGLKSKGVQVEGKWFHSDSDSRIQYLALKDISRDILDSGGDISSLIKISNRSVDWKTMDGSFITLTVGLVLEIVKKLAELDNTLFLVAQNHKEKMLAAKDPSVYSYKQGWPKGFEQ